MSTLLQNFSIVLPVFLVIVVGYCLKHTRLIDASFLFQLNRLVFYVALPTMLFHKIASNDFQASFNPRLLFGVLAIIVASAILSYGYGLFRKYPPQKLGAFCQGIFRGNVAYFGLAIIFNAWGETGFATAGIIIGFLVPPMNFLAVMAMLLPMRSSDHTMGSAFWMYQFAFNPLIISSFLGIAWSYFDLPLPAVIDSSMDIIAGMALPLALIAIGGSFSPQRLKGDIVTASLATIMKIIVMPLVAIPLLLALGVTGQDLGVGIILLAAPTATAAFIMAQQLKSDVELTGTIIMLSSLCSVATYTGLLYLLSILNV
ncbi:AEC family transporter [Desulfosediminicola sp.]|uniref:AEC family transporter n=1 Tax=Desulfosediminicola sp. TaxID=2886825 RepID=UPI003AF2D33D